MSKYIDVEILDVMAFNDATPDFIRGAIAVLETLDELPIADVQEVRYGRWELDEYGGWHCSVCHEIAIVSGGENYCPNCGARMDEVEE